MHGARPSSMRQDQSTITAGRRFHRTFYEKLLPDTNWFAARMRGAKRELDPGGHADPSRAWLLIDT